MRPATAGSQIRCAALVAAAFVVLLAVPTSLRGQAISGRFVDAGTQAGVEAVQVAIRNAEGELVGTGVSDSEGLFRVSLRVGGGPLRLEVEHLAYVGPGIDSLFVGASEVLALSAIALEPRPIALDPIIARAPPAPWVTRGEEWVRRNQLLEKGTFLAGAIVRLLKPPSLTDHIADAAGLAVRVSPSGYKTLWHPGSGNGEDCIDVRLNRWPLLYPIDYLPLADVAGIEVYKDAIDVPIAYAWDHDRRCGIVNIWMWDSWR